MDNDERFQIPVQIPVKCCVFSLKRGTKTLSEIFGLGLRISDTLGGEMRVSEWSDIHVSISAMQLSLPKMSGGDGDDGLEEAGLCQGERERDGARACPSDSPSVRPSLSGGGRLSAGGASERGSSSVSFPFGGRRTDTDGIARRRPR